jgi:hypothetical protein
MRPLPADRKIPPMTHAAIRPDLDQSLDVERDRFAQISFDATFLVDYPLDRPRLLFGQIADLERALDPGLPQYVERPRAADSVDVGQPDLDPLAGR